MKDTAQASAVTAMTVAGAAAVKGITVGATNVYKAINKKELLKIQVDIYEQLNTCSNMIEGLINIKNITNSKIQRTPSIVEYTTDLDVQNDTTGQFKNLIVKNGISGCVQKLENLIKQSLAKADSHKLMDELIIDNQGKRAGTLRAYGDSINTRLNLLKQLHNKTEQLVRSNRASIETQRQMESELRYLESQQPVIVESIRNQLNTLDLQLNNIRQKDTNNMSLDELNHHKNTLDSIDINTTQDSLTNTLNLLSNNLAIEEANRLNTDILQLSREAENVITDLYSAENYTEAYNSVRTKLSELKLRNK